jgi:precorrin-2 dehydrogenase/sirohydrochlorin ferrochelatase
MTWMSEVCDKWSVDDFNVMDDEDVRNLIQYYEPGKVPSFEEIRLGPRGDVVWEFDGSFGWA